MKSLHENQLRKYQAATIIAQSLGYHPKEEKSPQEIIELALESVKELNPKQLLIVREMLKLAEDVGVPYSGNTLTILESEDEEELSDEDLESMANTVDELDDVVDVYDHGEIEIVDDETGETVDDLRDELQESELNEVLSRIERIKSKFRFHKTAAKRERKLKIALKRHSTSSQINNRARRLAINLMKQRIAKKPLNQLSVADKERIEKIIARRKPVINRLALKLTSRIRMIEKNRLSRKKT